MSRTVTLFPIHGAAVAEELLVLRPRLDDSLPAVPMRISDLLAVLHVRLPLSFL